MKRPGEADIEAAKEYVRQRIECEQAMTTLLESVMKEAAEKIVDICYSAGVNPQSFRYSDLPVRVQFDIDAVIEWLREAIDDYFLTFAIADHEENRDKILPLILGKNHGLTFGERLENYCDKYRAELMLLIGAGLLLGIGESALIKSISDNLRRPYTNQLLADGISSPLTYGRGHTNSMFTAIYTLTKFGVGKGWMFNRHLEAEIKEAQGFMTFRNSHYPCDICDEYASYVHPMDDPIPPIHANCVCGTIYFNAYGEPINF